MVDAGESRERRIIMVGKDAMDIEPLDFSVLPERLLQVGVSI